MSTIKEVDCMCMQQRFTLTACTCKLAKLMVAICNIFLFLEINGNTNLAKRPHTQSCYYICQDCLVHLGDIGKPVIKCTLLLRATRGARNPNLQVVITHVSHVCSQHSFGLLLRITGIVHITHFDQARLDLLLLVI